jgi:hypothetical protein
VVWFECDITQQIRVYDEGRAEWVELRFTYRTEALFGQLGGGQRGLEERKQQAERNLRVTS